MIKVTFPEKVDDSLFQFAVSVARADGKWVFCKHRDRDTFEFPGGHRENGEPILYTAVRELLEETGASDYILKAVCPYCVVDTDDPNAQESFGLLCYADILKFGNGLHHEIDRVLITDKLADNWTYPQIQPALLEEVRRRGLI